MGAPGELTGPLVLASSLPGAEGGLASAAAVAVAMARHGGEAVVLVEADAVRARRPTIVASQAARALETELRDREISAAAARGSLCWVAGGEWRDAVIAAHGRPIVVYLGAAGLRIALDNMRAGLAPDVGPDVLIRADPKRHRNLASLLVADCGPSTARVRVMARPPGVVGTRRALAGIECGGEAGRRAGRLARRLRRPAQARGSERGQALPLLAGVALLVAVITLTLAALGGAMTAGGRLQADADLAAVSAARSMRDDYARLFLPARLAGGAPNPRRLSEAAYRDRAKAAAQLAQRRNGASGARLIVRFPAGLRPPTRVTVRIGGRLGRRREMRVSATATAEAYVSSASPSTRPAHAAGGGYSGPLASRQGEPMRPDVAGAYDRLAAAASRAGYSLTINSAYRSDAEQARLFAANPDPRWVARPGTSLHRCATELDLGPVAAYTWLAAHAPRFGFVRRYAWEAWHFGYDGGPAPCSDAANRIGSLGNDGRSGAGGGMPSFVPARFREPIAVAASRWNVPAALLAAQLLAESGFDPGARSPVGAEGIAQFMPGTAAAYGLGDPFDAASAIGAQAHLMADNLREFGSVELALAAYNAGSGAVAACGCVPSYPETQAYVARILGLMGGAGAAPPPDLEVRLVA